MTRVRRLAFYLLGGLLATDTACTASLLVDGVTAKRVAAVATGVIVAAVAGVVHGIRTPVPSQPTTQPTLDGSQP